MYNDFTYRIQSIIDILSNALRIPMRYHDLLSGVVNQCQTSIQLDVSFMEDANILAWYQDQDNPQPAVKSTMFCEAYGAVPIYDHRTLKGVMILGPVVEGRLTAASIRSIAVSVGIPDEKREQFLEIHQKLPNVPYHQFLWCVVLAARMLGHEGVGATDIQSIGAEPEDDGNQVNQQLDAALEQSREKAFFHTTLLFERTLMQYVKDGDPQKMMRYLKQAQVGNVGVMSDTALRQHQNESIICVALASRAAIEAGVHPEIAFTLSDIYIQKIEQMSQPTPIQQVTMQMLNDFTARVSMAKRRAHYTKQTRQAMDYIYLHLHDDITVENIAEQLHVGRSHLSTCFRKDTGIAISEYIAVQRVEEAKSLLINSGLSVSEISVRVNFHTVSHFCEVFRRITGKTPGEFRKLNGYI